MNAYESRKIVPARLSIRSGSDQIRQPCQGLSHSLAQTSPPDRSTSPTISPSPSYSQTMSPTTALLTKPLLFLDGGLGTTLEDQYSITFTPATPLWSSHLLLSSPGTLKQAHQAFARAGADILLTATYQSSISGFARTRGDSGYVSQTDAERYMLSAVPLARSSFEDKPGLVALSLGAYGATMVPSTEYSGAYGSMTESDLISFHSDRLSVFLNNSAAWSDIDLLAFETLPRLDEICAVRRVMSDLLQGQRKPYWISCVFPNDDELLPDGTGIREVVRAALLPDGQQDLPLPLPLAIGINCTKVHKLPKLIRQFEQAIADAGLPFPQLVLYPDGAGGQVYDTRSQKWLEVAGNATETSEAKSWDEEVFQIVKEVQDRGRWKGLIVGGCCKTVPSHIARLRERSEGHGGNRAKAAGRRCLAVGTSAYRVLRALSSLTKNNHAVRPIEYAMASSTSQERIPHHICISRAQPHFFARPPSRLNSSARP